MGSGGKYNIYNIIFLLSLLSFVFINQIKGQNEASMTLGNTFIHAEGNLTVFDQHQFESNNLGDLPGVVGSERMPSRGYFNFASESSWFGAGNNRFIDGYARYFGQQPFLFPIGDNNKYRPAAVSNGDYVEAAYYGVNPAIAITSDLKGGNYPVLPESGPFNPELFESSILKVSKFEYWDINGPDPAFLTLTWDEDSNIDSITSGILQELTIVGWDGTQWVKIPSKVNANTVNHSDNTVSFNGPVPTIEYGSISTSIQIVPSSFEVYTFGASCNDIAVLVSADTTICIGEEIQLTAYSPTHSDAEIHWDNGMQGSQITVSPQQTKYFGATAILGDCSAADDILVTVSDPYVDLGEDFFICRGDEVVIQAESSPNVSYEWSNGNFGGDNIIISPLSSQTYTVSITNEFGCQTTDDIFVEVRDKPDVFTGRERSVCLGDSVFIQAFGSATGYGYLWSTGDTLDIINVSPTVDTDYEVYLSNNGCTDTSYVSVLILEPLPVDIVGDSIICQGDEVTLSAVGDGTKFIWSTGDQDSTITLTPLSSGSYQVTMTSEELCESVDNFYVSVYDSDLIQINNNLILCPGDTAAFEASGIMDSIIWPDGSMANSFEFVTDHDTTLLATTYYNSCSTEIPLNINIEADIDFSLGPDLNICRNDEITIGIDSLEGEFIWNTGDTTAQISVSPDESTLYSVTITSNNCYDEDSIFINVDTLGCKHDIYVEKTVSDNSPVAGDTIVFTIEAGNNTNNYLSNIVISEKLKSGFEYVSHQVTRGIYDTSSEEWQIEYLNGQESAFLYLTVKVSLLGGPYDNTAYIIDPSPLDSVSSNNIAYISISPAFLGEIGDRIWHDQNGDGIQDTGEPGLEGMKVDLFSPGTPSAIQSTQSDSTGYYSFDGLVDGDYYINIEVPDTCMLAPAFVSESNLNVDENEDSNFNQSGNIGSSDTITIVNGSQINSIDAGLHKYSSIGDIVWMESSNGINNVYKEGVDELVDGVKIQLYDGVDSTMIAEQLTVNGRYLFERLLPGAYYLRISDLPPGTELVLPNIGISDRNSDFIPMANNNEGFTQMIYLGVEEFNMSVDAGIKMTNPPIVVPPTPHLPGWVTPWQHNKKPIFRLPNNPLWGFLIHYLNNFSYWNDEEIEPEISLRQESHPKAAVEPDYRIYPNPTRHLLKLEIHSSEEVMIMGSLIDGIGQNVKKIPEQTLSQGRNIIEIPVENLPQGQYYLNFFLDKKQYIEKVIVIN